MKEALLYQTLPNNQVKCLLCHHYCLIEDGNFGVCKVRQNQDGKLFSLNYGKIVSEAIDPIEKKPLFHFLPGSETYSIATVGCNLSCLNCQNWQISQIIEHRTFNIKPKIITGEKTTAVEIIANTKKANCASIAYTYTEPTIFFEFALDCMKLAKKEGLKNVWVSNGYMTKKCLDEIIPYLDAINVDLKFFSEKIYLENCGAKVQPILDNLKYLYQNKIHLEVTTLLIPGLTDIENQPEQMALFIKNELSEDIPWHLSLFSPEISYKLKNYQTTPIKLIDQVYEIGKKTGLNYVYVGNVFGDQRENTYCPNCHKLNIERISYQIERSDLKGKCFSCHYDLKIV